MKKWSVSYILLYCHNRYTSIDDSMGWNLPQKIFSVIYNSNIAKSNVFKFDASFLSLVDLSSSFLSKNFFFQCLFKTSIDLLVYCLFQFSKFVSFLTWPHFPTKNPKFFLMLAIEVNYVIYAFLLSVAITLVNKIA